MTRPTLRLFGDIVYPFTYALHNGLLPSIDHGMTVMWHGVELHPELPEGGEAVPKQHAGRLWASQRRILDAWDLPITRTAPLLRPSTRLLHEALAAAPDLDAAVHAAYVAWWEDGQDLESLSFRSALANNADLDDAALEERVERTAALASQLGVASVPALVKEDGRILYGLMDRDELADFLGEP